MKTTRSTKPLAFAALTALLAGCGGGGAHSSAPGALPNVPSQTQQSSGRAGATFRITIPQRTSSSTQRSPKYISSKTQSLGVVVTPSGGSAMAVQTFDLTAGSKNAQCSGTPLTCTITINAPVGNDSFDFKAYDGAGGQGNVLSHAVVTQAVAASGTTVNATLGGVVAQLSLSSAATQPWETSFVDGTAGTVTYTINALDAAGQTIIGAFDQPIAVSLVDGAAAPTVSLKVTPPTGSTSACADPEDCTINENGDVITASYNGGTDPAGASVKFSIGTNNALAVASIGMYPATVTGGASFPLSAGLGLVAWYDAQDLNSITQNAGAWPTSIATLKDKSGKGINLTAAGTAPTVDPSGQGAPANRPAPSINFASGGSCLASQTGFPTNSDYSIVALLSPASDTRAIVGGNPPSSQSYAGHHFEFDPNDSLLTQVQNETAVVKEVPVNGQGSLGLGTHAIELDYSQAGHVGTLIPDLNPSSKYTTQIGGSLTLVGNATGPAAGDVVSVTINGGTPISYTVTAADVSSNDVLGAITRGLATNISKDPTASKLVTTVPAANATTGGSFTDQNGNYLGQMELKASTAAGFTMNATTTSTGMKVLLGDNTVDSALLLNCINNPQNTLDTGSNHIEEVLVFNRTLTATDRKNIQTYLNRKWGLNYGAGF